MSYSLFILPQIIKFIFTFIPKTCRHRKLHPLNSLFIIYSNMKTRVTKSFTLTIYMHKSYSHSRFLTNTLQTCTLHSLSPYDKHFASMELKVIEAFCQTLSNNEFKIILQHIYLIKFII